MGFYVSLQDVEDIIMHGEWSDEHELINEIKHCATLISARKLSHGYWKYDGEFYYKCSECGYNASFRYDYCPNCGADMRGDKP